MASSKALSSGRLKTFSPIKFALGATPLIPISFCEAAMIPATAVP